MPWLPAMCSNLSCISRLGMIIEAYDVGIFGILPVLSPYCKIPKLKGNCNAFTSLHFPVLAARCFVVLLAIHCSVVDFVPSQAEV